MFLLRVCDFQELQGQHANTIGQGYPENAALLVHPATPALQVITEQFKLTFFKT